MERFNSFRQTGFESIKRFDSFRLILLFNKKMTQLIEWQIIQTFFVIQWKYLIHWDNDNIWLKKKIINQTNNLDRICDFFIKKD